VWDWSVNGLHEESSQGLLEVGNGTVGVGKGGVKMSENLGRRQSSQDTRCPRGRRTLAQEGRANAALAEVEAFADPLPGTVAQMARSGADGGPQAAGEKTLEEGPQSARGEAEPTDLVGEPDAEGASATASPRTITAEDTACPQGFASGAGVVKAVQGAMANQETHGVAMRTGRQLELLDDGNPLIIATEEPWHGVPVSPGRAEKGHSTGAG
jgi:hypothetical protein